MNWLARLFGHTGGRLGEVLLPGASGTEILHAINARLNADGKNVSRYTIRSTVPLVAVKKAELRQVFVDLAGVAVFIKNKYSI